MLSNSLANDEQDSRIPYDYESLLPPNPVVLTTTDPHQTTDTPPTVKDEAQPEDTDNWTQKRVKFAYKLCDYCPCTDGELDPDEIGRVWYRRSEYKLFDRDKKATIQALREVQGNVFALDEMIYCVRGFENYLSSREYDNKRRNRHEHKRTVIQEQRRQQTLGVYDDEAFAYAVWVFSSWSAELALDLAKQDEDDAMDDNSLSHSPNQTWDVPTKNIPRADHRNSLIITKCKGSALDQFLSTWEDEEEDIDSTDASKDAWANDSLNILGEQWDTEP